MANSNNPKLDPRTKLFLILIFAITIFVSRSYLPLLFVFLLILVSAIFSNVSLKLLIKVLTKFSIFFILIILLPALFGSGFVIFRFAKITIFGEGLMRGAFRACQFALVIMIVTIFNATTSFAEIADGITLLLKPMRNQLATQITVIFSITLNFIPILQSEAKRILNAQTSRGAYFDKNLIKRSLQMLPLLIPIFNSVFRKADLLAMALDAKGYKWNLERTYYVSLKIKKYEWLLMALSIAYLIFVLIMR
ncbi:hypothetical protein B6D52_03465 [Candidatus Parcubacteria bacterium 4484_255]|nr:MAG: hypothetical protein B6D52_03465 [Candidatus Parcubacteria bacterium 4484_255]